MLLLQHVLNIRPTSRAEQIKSSHQKILPTSKQTWPRARHTNGVETRSRAAKAGKDGWPLQRQTPAVRPHYWREKSRDTQTPGDDETDLPSTGVGVK